MKLQRIYRKERVSAEEAARNRELRRLIQEEFPPKRKHVERAEPSVELEAIMPTLKGVREAQGLSLTDLKERSGIGRPALSRLENGDNANPTISTLKRYARALGKRIHVVLVDDSSRVNQASS